MKRWRIVFGSFSAHYVVQLRLLRKGCFGRPIWVEIGSFFFDPEYHSPEEYAEKVAAVFRNRQKRRESRSKWRRDQKLIAERLLQTY